MTISEMHVWFRQYAQQMGMQNVRAILPEQIDNLINTSIRDTIDEIVRTNVGTTNDRIITDNAKLANINALRTLYKVYSMTPSSTVTITNPNEPHTFTSASIADALYFVDFAVRYSVNGSTTRWFPVRIIDDSYLADVLNDWVLAPRMRTPIMVVYKASPSSVTDLQTAVNTALSAFNTASAAYASAQTAANLGAMNAAKTAYDNAVAALNTANSANAELTKFDIYFGENDSISSIAQSATLSQIRCSYIKKPNRVQYLSDVGGTNIDSDLPEQLQIPMLKHAVDLYRASIQGSLFASQQQAQEQQRENVRNNARPDNEGYQS